jgi:hypothetical protein
MSEDDTIQLRAMKVMHGLQERYSEAFAISPAEPPDFGRRVYLWLISVLPNIDSTSRPAMGAWSLVRTFVPKNVSPSAAKIHPRDVIMLIDTALSGKNPELLASLDTSVAKAKARIANKKQS